MKTKKIVHRNLLKLSCKIKKIAMRTLWNSMNETKETLKIAVVLGKQWLMDSNNSFERLFIHTSKQKKKTKN